MPTKTEKHAIGFICRCGKQHLFSLQVHQNWNQFVETTCDLCNARYVTKQGRTKSRRNYEEATIVYSK